MQRKIPMVHGGYNIAGQIGREQKKSQKRGFKTKKEAEEWYAHFRLQQSSDPTMTLADFWKIYRADMEKRLRKTTMKQKEYMMNDKVLPYFGKMPINEITAPMIRKWQGEMMEICSMGIRL